jgi:hypothetical protein
MDCFDRKMQLRQLIHLNYLHQVPFGETTLQDDFKIPKEIYGRRFTFSYQRDDLKITSKNKIRTFYPEAHHLNVPCQGFFTSCGQAALSTALLLVQHVYPGTRVHFDRFIYWETHRFLKLNRLLKPSGPFSILFDSSTESPDTFARLQRLMPKAKSLIVDTTCWPLQSERIDQVVGLAKKYQVPLLLARSHIKLDSMGMEYGRLGSLVVVANGQKHALIEKLEPLLSSCGSKAPLAQIYPFYWDQDFHKLNNKWQSRIQAANRSFESSLDRSFDQSQRKNFFHFSHGLYSWYALPKTVTKRRLMNELKVLAGSLNFSEIPHKFNASYPWDILSVTVFTAAHNYGPQLAGRPIVRFSVGDFNDELVERLARVVNTWVKRFSK